MENPKEDSQPERRRLCRRSRQSSSTNQPSLRLSSLELCTRPATKQEISARSLMNLLKKTKEYSHPERKSRRLWSRMGITMVRSNIDDFHLPRFDPRRLYPFDSLRSLRVTAVGRFL